MSRFAYEELVRGMASELGFKQIELGANGETSLVLDDSEIIHIGYVEELDRLVLLYCLDEVDAGLAAARTDMLFFNSGRHPDGPLCALTPEARAAVLIDRPARSALDAAALIERMAALLKEAHSLTSTIKARGDERTQPADSTTLGSQGVRI